MKLTIRKGGRNIVLPPCITDFNLSRTHRTDLPLYLLLLLRLTPAEPEDRLRFHALLALFCVADQKFASEPPEEVEVLKLPAATADLAISEMMTRSPFWTTMAKVTASLWFSTENR